LRVSGPDGYLTVVEMTSDFQTWTSLGTHQIVNGSVVVSDDTAPYSSARFYRIRLASVVP